MITSAPSSRKALQMIVRKRRVFDENFAYHPDLDGVPLHDRNFGKLLNRSSCNSSDLGMPDVLPRTQLVPQLLCQTFG